MKEIAILLTAVSIAFGSGWTIKGWQRDAVELAIKDTAYATAARWQANETELAKVVTKKLKGLRANERIIERQIPQIVDRPIYNIECIDIDGLRIINGYGDVETVGSSTTSTLRPQAKMDGYQRGADRNPG